MSTEEGSRRKQLLVERRHSQQLGRWGQISLQQLEVLLCLAREGHATSAAHELGYENLSSFLYHLNRLEELVGVPLIHRGRQHAVVTEAGQALCEAAGPVLDAVSKAKSKLADSKERDLRRLRIGTVLSVVSLANQALFKLGASTIARTDWSIYSLEQDAGQTLLQEGLDVFLTTRATTSPDLITEPLGVEEMLVLCAASHPLSQSGPGVLRLLDESVFHVGEMGNEGRLALDEIVARLHISPKRVVQNNLEEIKQHVVAGDGITVLPRSMVSSELAGGILCIANTKGVRLVRHVYAIHLAGRPVSPEVRLFLRSLAACLDRSL